MNMPPRWMYHLTRRDRLSAIQREGLRPGKPLLLTYAASAEHMHEPAYGGTRPIYLSIEPWVAVEEYRRLAEFGSADDFVLLSVDTADHALVADIPSLADAGAYLEEDHLWFEDSNALAAFEDTDGQITYERLLNEPALIRAAIELTGTAACCEPIAPDRVRVVEIGPGL